MYLRGIRNKCTPGRQSFLCSECEFVQDIIILLSVTIGSKLFKGKRDENAVKSPALIYLLNSVLPTDSVMRDSA